MRNRRPTPKTPRRALVEELEQRLLFSADVLPEAAPLAPDVEVMEAPLEPAAESEPAAAETTTRHEIVFVDSRVPDAQQLLDDLLADPSDERRFDVFVLNPDADGIGQISQALAGYDGDLDAVHVISHGTSAAVQLGSAWLDASSVSAHEGAIAGWGDALAKEADLLFYGCDLAQGEEGRALLDELAELTGADVAASVDDTGHAIFGANWELEVATGAIESEVALSASLQSTWGHVLAVGVDATSTGQSASPDGMTISHTTSGTDRLMLVSVVTEQNTAGDSISSITYNGASLSFVGTDDHSSVSPAQLKIEVWALVAPDLGTHDVVVNFTSEPKDATVGVMTFTGVDQTTPLGAFASTEGESTSASTTVSSAAGDLVYGSVAVRKGTDATPGAGQTESFDNNFANLQGAGSTEAGAASVTTSWSLDLLEKWVATGVPIQAAPTPPASDPLWLSTTGTNGVEGFGEPSLAFEDPADNTLVTTSGTLSLDFDIDLFAAGANVDAVHYVSRDIQVGASNFQLEAGDLLLSVDNAETLTSLSIPTDPGFTNNLPVDDQHVFVFRPDTPGDYSAGTFAMLLDDPVADVVVGISLIERTTTVGDVTLRPGDFLIVHGGFQGDIGLWETTDVGAGTTSGTYSTLLAGGDANVNLGADIAGVDLVEDTTTVGGQTLNRGTLLVTVVSNKSVGMNALPTNQLDIFALDVAKTTLMAGAGNGEATASYFFEGGEGGLGSEPDGFTLTVPVTASPPDAAFWVSTSGDSATGGAGLGDWTKGEALGFGDPNLQLEPVSGTTTGTLFPAFNLDDFGSANNLGAMHYVTRDLQVGASNFDLFAGDLLMSTQSGGTYTSLSGVTVTKEDVFLFRPASPGDYTSGHFMMLLESPTGTDITGFTLVEQNTVVGLAPLQAGDFLLVKADSDIDLYETIDVGPSNTSGTLSTFLAGADAGVGFSKSLHGLDLLEDATTIGGQPFAAGTLFSTMNTATAVGGNSLPVTKWDLFALDVTQTTLLAGPGNGAATATLVVEGADVDLADGGEEFNAVTTLAVSSNVAPVLGNNSLTISEGGTVVLGAANVSATDVDDPDASLTFSVLGVTGGRFERVSAPGVPITSFLQSEVTASQIRFVHDGSETPAAYNVEVSDGSLTDGPTAATITYTPVNDTPTIAGTVASQAVTDKTTVDPFSGVTIGDVDNPAQTLTVDVQLDLAAKGALSNLGGFSDLGGGLYRFSGTAAAATTAIQALTFDPAENRVTPGSTETTTFTISVDDGIAAPVADATTTVISTSVNDASTVGGTVAGQAVTDKTTVDPFSGVTIGDLDNPAQTLTVDVQLDLAAKGALSNLGGFSDLGGGLYRFSGTAAAATTAIQALTFDPAENRVTPGSTETTTFTISVDDGIAAPTVDATTTVISTSVNDASTIGGAVAGQAVTDKTTVDPFSGVTIGDLDNPAQTLTVDVQLDLAAKGALSNLGGFSDLGGGLYRFSGTAAAATTAIQALTFDPAENRVTPGSTETTTFTISVDDGIAAPTVDATTTVISTSVNDASTIGGAVAGQAVTDKTTVDPFSGVTIGDVDNPAQTLTVDVQLDLAAKGALSNLGGFSDLGGGLYRFSGTAAAATTAIQALTFDPAENRVTPGSTETTTFTISVDDGIAAPTVDATTTVISTSVNDASTIGGAVAGQAVTDKTTVDPFSGVTIGDVDNPAQTLTVDVQLDLAAKGVLSNLGGFSDLGGGLYRFSGTAAAATTAIQALTFDPAENRVTPGSTETTTFTISVDDGIAAPVADATTTVISTSVNDASTVGGTVAGQAVTDKTTVDPFSGVTIGDLDNPAQTLTVDVQLDLAAKGALSNLGGFSDLGGGLYRFSGTAAAATTAIQALTFDPAENRVTPGSTETTTFTISVDDGIAAPTVDATTTVISTSVNDASTIGGAVAGQAVTDKTTVDPFSGVTIGDVDNPAQTLTVDVQLDLAAKGALSNLGGFSDLGGGLYRFSGTAAAATTAIQALTFDPAENRVAPGLTETTTFTISVDDGIAAPTVDATTTVISTSVNDAPVLDPSGDTTLGTIFENETDPAGDAVSAVIASAGGDRITDSDVAAIEGIAVTGVDDSNGTWQYSTNNGATWSALGGVTDGSAVLLGTSANNRVRFVPNPGFAGTADLTFRAWDQSDGNTSGTAGINTVPNGGTTAFSLASEIARISVDPAEVILWLSTKGDVTGSGVPGFPSWSEGEVLGLGDPALDFGTTTDGTFRSIVDIDSFAADSDVETTGLHYVTTDITVGSANAVDLFAGDLLFVAQQNETLTSTNTLAIAGGDVILFRPDTPGDYSSGTFTHLLDQPGVNVTMGISLIEEDTTVGDVTLSAGTFLFTQEGAIQGNRIYHFTADDVGPGTTTGTVAILIDGDDAGIGISSSIRGVELVEFSMVLGGELVNSGSLLVTLEDDDASVGTNGLSVLQQDVFVLDPSTTTLGSGNANATASMLFDGSDVNIDASAEDVDAVGLIVRGVGGNTAPVLALAEPPLAYTENDPAALLAATGTATDSDSPDFFGGQLRVDFTAGGAAGDRLAIRDEGGGPGQVGISGASVTYGALTVGTFGGGSSGSDPLVVTFNSNASEAIVQAVMNNVTYANVSDDPSTASRTVRFLLSDGDGGSSNAVTRTIDVTAVNDAPSLDANALTISEDGTVVFTGTELSASDPDDADASLSFTVSAISGGHFERVSVPTVPITTFLQSEVTAADIRFVHDGGEAAPAYSVTVDDGSLSDGPAPAVISFTNVNDPPTLLGTVAGQAVTDKTTVDPFTGVTIGDVDNPAQTLTVDVQLDLDAKGDLTNLGAFSDLGGGLYQFSGTAAAATTAIQALTFDPAENRVTPGSTETTTFTISVDDGIAAPTVDATTTVISTSVNDASTVGGTVAGQAVTDKTTVDPFTGVTIGDLDNPAQTLTVDVQLDLDAKGDLTNLSGFTDLGGGLYRFSGTAAAATTAIQSLTFDPAENRVAPGLTETTTFTITVDDGIAAPTVDATTTVISTSVNDASTVAGTVAGQAVTDKTTVDPLTGVTIGDLDNPAQTLTVDVQLDLDAKGDLTNLSGFTDLGGGLYRFSGTAAAATTAIQSLTFDPAENRVAPGLTETTTFTITVDDGIAAPTVDATTTVISTSVNDASTVAGTVAGQAVTDKTTVDPFTGVTLGDVDNPAQTLTVDIQLDVDAKGDLTNLSGFTDLGGGLYRFSGTAAAATTAIQSLTFDPAENRVAPGLTETTTFTITVDDGIAAPTVDATTTVISTSVNDASTVGGTVAGQAVTDKTTVDPFTGATIGDLDNPAQTLTVDVQLDLDAKGDLTNLGGFTDLGGGHYQFSGTAAAATTAIQALTFDPAENRVAPGLTETTTFTLTVDDGIAAPTVDTVTTVISTSVNDASTVTGTVAGQAVTDKTTVDPFTGVSIGDLDNPAQTLTVDVQLDVDAKGDLTNLGGFTDLGGGLYRFSGTAAAATTAIQALTFDPSENRVTPGGTETTTFTITVDDGIAAPTVDAVTTVISTSVNDASTVGGTVAGQAVTDKTTVDPFSGVTLGDVDNPAQTLTVDVQLDLDAKGDLTNLGGFTDLGGGLYRFSGTAAAATTAIQALTFDPAENRVAPGLTETTIFTVTVDDGIAAPTVDATTTVISTSINDPSTIAGAVAGHAVTDKTTVDPFTGVTVGDVDNPAQTLVVDVQLDLAAKGSLLNLSGFTGLGGGLYRFSGTAAAATTAIRGLTFDPTENRVAPGLTETTTFTITVDDGIAAPTVDATTTVVSTSINDAPTIAGSVAGQAVTDKTTVDPFSGVTVGDVDNPAQTLTVDVQLDLTAKGVLTNLGGFSDLGGGLYRFSGTAAAATSAIQALTFDPTENRVAPGLTETTTFTITVVDGIAAPTVDAATTVIATSVNDAPAIAGTVAGQAVTDQTTVDPFTGVTIGDVDNPAQTLVVDVQLDLAAKGSLLNLSGFTDLGGGLYRFSGTAAAATSAIQALTFDPTENRVAPGLTETTTFTITVDDGIAAPTVDATTSVISTSVNDASTVAGTVAGQAVTDKTTVDPFTGVTLGDVDNPAQTLVVDVQLDLAAKGSLLNLSGFTDLGGGLYRFSGTAAAATSAIQALTFDPTENRVAPGLTETTTFTITVDDGIAAPTVDATASVISTSVNDASTVAGTVAGQAVTDKTTVDPFTGVTLGDVDNPAQTLVVDVQLDLAAKGSLLNLSGFTDLGGGLYRFSGTAAAATTAIRGLTFDPTENRVAPGLTETTTFTITVDDGIAAPTVDATTTVVSTSINDAPTIAGSVAGQAITDKATVDPFTAVTVGDVDNPAQTLSVDVQLDLAAKGVLTNLGGFSDLGGGLYRLTGTAATATTAIRGLTFDPAENRVAPGLTETTTFTITVDDGLAAPTVDNTTSVISTSINDAPSLSGTAAGQIVTDKGTVDPFTIVNVSDPDPGQPLTVDVQLDLAAKGSLTNLGGFSDLGGGLYRFTGSPAAAVTALQGLTFVPAENRVAPGLTETTAFTVTVDDAVAAPILDATTSVISTSINDAPSVANRTFTVPASSANGSVVGSVPAADPDMGESLIWTITGGNTGSAFAIDPVTGQLRIADASALGAGPFTLSVRVDDANGAAGTASVSIGVSGTTEPDPDPVPDPVVPPPPDPVPAPEPAETPEPTEEPTLEVETEPEPVPAVTPAQAAEPGERFIDLDLLPPPTANTLSLALAAPTPEATPPVSAPAPEPALADRPEAAALVVDDAMWRALDELGDEMSEAFEDPGFQMMVISAEAASIATSAGILSWLLRAGSMTGSLLSTLPLWSRFDPLYVLPGDSEERRREVTKPDEEERDLDRVFNGDEDPEDSQESSPAS